jgi:hypothetical protein
MLGDEFVARADLALPEIRLAIEYDGQWHSDPYQLGRDRARLREINRGWLACLPRDQGRHAKSGQSGTRYQVGDRDPPSGAQVVDRLTISTGSRIPAGVKPKMRP